MNLEQAVASLLVDLPMLQAAARGIPGRGQGGPRAKSAPLPGGTGAMSLVHEVHAVVSSWCGVILDAHPNGAGRVPDDTEGRLRYLDSWAAAMARDMGVEHELCRDELADLAGRARALVQPPVLRRVPVGSCPECHGVLWASLRAPGGEPVDTVTPPPVSCDVHPVDHAWARADDPDLVGRVGIVGPQRLTEVEWCEFVADKYGKRVNPETVRSWRRFHPDKVGWDGSTVDTRATVIHWFERRALAV